MALASIRPESQKLADFLAEYFGVTCTGQGTGFYRDVLVLPHGMSISLDYLDKAAWVVFVKEVAGRTQRVSYRVTSMDRLLEILSLQLPVNKENANASTS
jgi:hypothetical protein